ncbi:MAG: L,D-transpeptidase family protein [Asticcacaulis sp.]
MVKIFTAYANKFLILNSDKVPCALGKEGVITADRKREGDLRSPAGIWRLKYIFYRPDRLQAPDTVLPVIALTPEDGWCDAPDHPDYNRHVKLPFDASHEKLWREDHIYDLIGILGHNDDPPVAGMGSAIFLHLARENYVGTEGCVALSQPDLLELLRQAEAETYIEISKDDAA